MTVGQTPPGWYDDGQGQLRYFDGAAWTDHVHPLPPASPQPEAAQPAAPQPEAAQPAAPQPAAAQPEVAQPQTVQPRPGSAPPQPATKVGAAVGSAKPVYKKPWFVVLVLLAVLALGAAAFLLSSGDDPKPTSSTTIPSSSPTPTGGTSASFFGQDASAVASKAGCLPASSVPTPIASPVQGAAPKSLVTCTLNGTMFTIATWSTAADQTNTASLANAFTAPVAEGTKYYARGEGWTAFDPAYTQASAQTFATAAGGTVKAIIVVTASPSTTTPSTTAPSPTTPSPTTP